LILDNVPALESRAHHSFMVACVAADEETIPPVSRTEKLRQWRLVGHLQDLADQSSVNRSAHYLAFLRALDRLFADRPCDLECVARQLAKQFSIHAHLLPPRW